MRISITYQGRRFSGKSLNYHYCDDSGQVMIFGKKLSTPHVVGSILEVTRTEDGVKSPYTFKSTETNSDLISEWSVLDSLAFDTSQTIKLNTKKLPSEYQDGLTALRFVYGKVPYNQRQAFINRLIVELTK